MQLGLFSPVFHVHAGMYHRIKHGWYRHDSVSMDGEILHGFIQTWVHKDKQVVTTHYESSVTYGANPERLAMMNRKENWQVPNIWVSPSKYKDKTGKKMVEIAGGLYPQKEALLIAREIIEVLVEMEEKENK